MTEFPIPEGDLTAAESEELLLMCGHARRPKPLSPAALAVWEAFNREEPGVFVDYGDCLAAALRAAADQVVPYEATAPWDELKCDYDGDHWEMRQWVRDQLIAIADELEGQV